MELRLHGFAQSGNSYKVALYLACAGLEFEPVLIQYGAGQTRGAAWRETVNPMGEAPVLEVDGRLMSQSGAILTWLAETTGHFAPENDADRFEVLRWLLFDNHKFTSYLATLRFQLTFAPSPPATELEAFLRGRIDAALAVVENHLAEHAFMVGKAPTVADFSMAGYVFFPPEELAYDLRLSHPAVHGWRRRMHDLPGWQAPYQLLPAADMARREAPYRSSTLDWN